MRLFLLSIIIAVVAWFEYFGANCLNSNLSTSIFECMNLEQLESRSDGGTLFNQREMFYLVLSLCLYLLIEALVNIKRSSSASKAALQLSPVNNSPVVIKPAEGEIKEAILDREIKILEEKLSNSKLEIDELKSQIKAESSSTEKLNRQAVILMGQLQSKGRLIDFLMEDIHQIEDTKLGSVARFVHQGCQNVLKDHFSISPVHLGKEGEKIKLNDEVDPSYCRLSGNVKGGDSFEGVVVHKGWKTDYIRLPQPANESHDNQELIIAPMEVKCI